MQENFRRELFEFEKNIPALNLRVFIIIDCVGVFMAKLQANTE